MSSYVVWLDYPLQATVSSANSKTFVYEKMRIKVHLFH